MATKNDQSRFSKIEILIGAATLFLTVVCSVCGVSYFCGSQITTVTSSIDSLKGELQETNLTLKIIKDDIVKSKIGQAQQLIKIDNLQKRVTKIQTKIQK